MARYPHYRRRRLRPFRLLFKLALLAGGLWLAGFFLFCGWVLSAQPPSPMPHADGIVALTGGDGRVGEALGLLAARDAPRLLVSGVGRGTYLGDLTADNTAAATDYAAAITLGHSASTTRTNASETAAWARANNIHSLIVATADYHMPRALLELAQSLPNVRLIAAPVRPPAMDNPLSQPTLRLLAGEYSKYLIVRAGFSSLAAALTEPD